MPPEQGLNPANQYILEYDGYFQDDGTFHPGQPPSRQEYSEWLSNEYIEDIDGYFDLNGHFHSGQVPE